MTPGRFRSLLRLSITSALGTTFAFAGCDAVVSGDDSTTESAGGTTEASSTGDLPRCYPATSPADDVVCFDWPCEPDSTDCLANQETTAASSSASSGGGGAGPCPSAEEMALRHYELHPGTCGIATVTILSTSAGGQCCYTREYNCCSGRPLLVDGRARLAVARAIDSAGWAGRTQPTMEGLDDETRAALAKLWLDDALMEHASVASFAKFALELVAVGAPADIVAAAHAAALDEIEHARLCFALASSYAGAELSPGPLDMAGLRIGSDLATLAASAVAEGCIGETLAAVLAAERLAGATDPAVRTALEKIAEDEARHATLAFRFVAWAIASGGEPVRRAVRTAFDSALARPLDAGLVAISDDSGRDALRAHGCVSETDIRASIRAVIAEVIAPAARQLVGVAPLAQSAVGLAFGCLRMSSSSLRTM